MVLVFIIKIYSEIGGLNGGVSLRREWQEGNMKIVFYLSKKEYMSIYS